MTLGLLYQVLPSAADVLEECQSLSDWHEAMDDIGLDTCPELDAEDALISWAELLHQHPALQPLFAGDLAAPDELGGAPCMRYINPQTAGQMAAVLLQLSDAEMLVLLGPEKASIWFKPVLQDFLAEAAETGAGVILMWGS